MSGQVSVRLGLELRLLLDYAHVFTCTETFKHEH